MLCFGVMNHVIMDRTSAGVLRQDLLGYLYDGKESDFWFSVLSDE